ncbi:MAG: 16S rRNA (uracil(1498)-N(3))-methyltransferase, partial [Thermoguttaceae bacterium]|nr:16S rRNA (uracil(1498)-N(3))-methyltransferase [Thermoguttaceae bacterium]
KVLRQKIGDEATLFDGTGKEYRCEITSIAKERVELAVLETREDSREPDVALTAVVALPKGDRQKWALEKLTELGVRRFIPLDAERADVKFDANVRERLERQVLEASKQCGRLRLLEVLPSVASSELPALVELIEARRAGKSLSSETCAADLGLSDAAEKLRVRFGATDLFDEIGPDANVLRVVAHPISDGFFGQQSFPELIRSLGDKTPQSVFLLIGPVGGFSDGEVSSAVEAGWKPLDLGDQVYRVETAAIVAAALFLHLK